MTKALEGNKDGVFYIGRYRYIGLPSLFVHIFVVERRVVQDFYADDRQRFGTGIPATGTGIPATIQLKSDRTGKEVEFEYKTTTFHLGGPILVYKTENDKMTLEVREHIKGF